MNEDDKPNASDQESGNQKVTVTYEAKVGWKSGQQRSIERALGMKKRVR